VIVSTSERIGEKVSSGRSHYWHVAGLVQQESRRITHAKKFLHALGIKLNSSRLVQAWIDSFAAARPQGNPDKPFY